MTHARIISTSDISENVLSRLRSSLPDDLPCEIDEHRIFQKSAEPPSWISFLAGADWWVQGLAAYAALYVAELVKEAAKSTWKNKGAAFTAGVGIANRLWQFASSLHDAISNSRADSYLVVGLPIPDEHHPTALRLRSSSIDDIAVELALFVHHLPAHTQLLIGSEIAKDCLGGVFLEVLPDGSLKIEWMDKDPMTKHRKDLPFSP